MTETLDRALDRTVRSHQNYGYAVGSKLGTAETAAVLALRCTRELRGLIEAAIGEAYARGVEDGRINDEAPASSVRPAGAHAG